jgi:putative transposase
MRRALPPPASQGAQSNYTKLAAEPDDHALGRSRGGWTTKIHALVDDSCAAVLLRLTAGQANDNPHWRRWWRPTPPLTAVGFGCWPIRPTRTTPPALICANTAFLIPFRSDPIRSLTAKPRDHVVDVRRPSTRRHTGTATPSNAASTASNTGVESLTRYDKYALTYLGGVTLGGELSAFDSADRPAGVAGLAPVPPRFRVHQRQPQTPRRYDRRLLRACYLSVNTAIAAMPPHAPTTTPNAPKVRPKPKPLSPPPADA